jgi:CHAD domain-containing protein
VSKRSLEQHILYAALEYARALAHERDAVIAGGDIEPLHRMRVASRRLRVALRVLKQASGAGRTKKLKGAIRRLGKTLGRARELDIQLRFLKNIRKEFSDRESLRKIASLAAKLQADRDNAQKKVVSYLRDPGVKKEFSGLAGRLKHLDFGEKKSDAQILRRMNKAILRLLGSLRKHGRFAHKEDDAESLHRLRIAAKKLRYMLETVKPCYGARLVSPINLSHGIQDLLGDLHELDVWIGFLSGKKEYAFLLEKCRKLRARVYRRFIGAWKALDRKKFWDGLPVRNDAT